ncbi:hypothetical protein PAXRUDRAFT_29195 [Paxillus rubicundulus Ve08.2h10]|uniref:Uncharacterized protein n=1 Tax=Paxillus rubicundulus Ve08.2h10 TaxID=930991 RepID=A0A0D0CSY4_9AGAM|nr:hypothetical protein PAXRUDRAFT_29195 [Paxillus rubicundulus Ve08.2h10]
MYYPRKKDVDIETPRATADVAEGCVWNGTECQWKGPPFSTFTKGRGILLRLCTWSTSFCFALAILLHNNPQLKIKPYKAWVVLALNLLYIKKVWKRIQEDVGGVPIITPIWWCRMLECYALIEAVVKHHELVFLMDPYAQEWHVMGMEPCDPFSPLAEDTQGVMDEEATKNAKATTAPKSKAGPSTLPTASSSQKRERSHSKVAAIASPQRKRPTRWNPAAHSENP